MMMYNNENSEDEIYDQDHNENAVVTVMRMSMEQ